MPPPPLPPIRFARVISEEFGENTYILHRDGRDDCVVVDPGMDWGKIVDHLEQGGLTPAAILVTHGHADHIAGNAALKQRWPDCRIVVGVADAPKLTDPVLNLSAGYGFSLVSPPADVTVRDGKVFAAAGIDFHVLAIPGHSAGHVVYLLRDEEPMLALVGDVIFYGGIGRCDFPDGDFDLLIRGIRQRLLTLPDDTKLLPGHGPATTVARERAANPYVGGILNNPRTSSASRPRPTPADLRLALVDAALDFRGQLPLVAAGDLRRQQRPAIANANHAQTGKLLLSRPGGVRPVDGHGKNRRPAPRRQHRESRLEWGNLAVASARPLGKNQHHLPALSSDAAIP